MFKIYKNKIISSDWHLLHPNIFVYEYEKRKSLLKSFVSKNEYNRLDELFFNFELKTKDEQDFIYKEAKRILFSGKSKDEKNKFLIDTNYFMLSLFLEELKKVDLSKINEYLNLWDFLFEVLNDKINFLLNSRLKTKLFEIHNLLKSHNIKRILILGNHDHGSLVNESIKEFYSSLFDEVVLQIQEGPDLFIHHPLWCSKSPYPPKGAFLELDLNLISNKNTILNCHHWHIHSSKLEWNLKWINYINYSLDGFL